MSSLSRLWEDCKVSLSKLPSLRSGCSPSRGHNHREQVQLGSRSASRQSPRSRWRTDRSPSRASPVYTMGRTGFVRRSWIHAGSGDAQSADNMAHPGTTSQKAQKSETQRSHRPINQRLHLRHRRNSKSRSKHRRGRRNGNPEPRHQRRQTRQRQLLRLRITGETRRDGLS